MNREQEAQLIKVLTRLNLSLQDHETGKAIAELERSLLASRLNLASLEAMPQAQESLAAPQPVEPRQVASGGQEKELRKASEPKAFKV